LNELAETSQLLTHSDIWLAGLKTLAMLFIVLGCLILVLYLMKRFFYQKSSLGQGNLIRVLSTYHVTPKGRVALIDVVGEKLLLGITSETITCLGKIKPSEALARLEETDQEKSGSGIFDKLLSGALGSSARLRK
jgi:flagellar protein FliO/FliZ